MGWAGELVMAASILLLLVAALTDLATRVIPDRIAITLAGLGVLSRAFAGLPSLAISLGLAALLFVLLVFAHARGILGGGDVKLIAATALGLAPGALYQFLVGTMLAGGVLALLHLVLRPVVRGTSMTPLSRGSPLLCRVLIVERYRIARRGSLPYGVAIACGGVWTVLASAGV